jgi:hypothetical protein
VCRREAGQIQALQERGLAGFLAYAQSRDPSSSADNLVAIASRAGVDGAKLKAGMKAPVPGSAGRHDRDTGQGHGTPGFFINGTFIGGALESRLQTGHRPEAAEAGAIRAWQGAATRW